MTNTIDWLLKGDPAIRWQVQRDLLNAPPKAYEKERAKITSKGWGARLLSKQDANGMWGGGIYTPKWISTTYTLLLLRQLGLPQNAPVRGFRRLQESPAGGSIPDRIKDRDQDSR